MKPTKKVFFRGFWLIEVQQFPVVGGVVVAAYSFWKLNSATVGNSIFPVVAWWRLCDAGGGMVQVVCCSGNVVEAEVAGGRSWVVGPRPKKCFVFSM
jgi:hypothetical protein